MNREIRNPGVPMKTTARPMFLLLLFLALLPSLAALAQAAPAAPAGIAVVDMDRVFQEFYRTKLADAQLKRQAEAFKEYADQLEGSRAKLEQEFKTLRDAAQNIALAEVERESRRLAAQDKYRQLQAKEAELAQYDQDKRQQLRDQYEKQREIILAEIKRVVERHRLAGGHALVLDASGRTLNNIAAVIAHDPAIDLTKAILEDLNRPARGKPAKNSPAAE
jgi:outer membrane protein